MAGKLGSLIFMKQNGKVIPFVGLQTSTYLTSRGGIAKVPYSRALNVISSKARHIIQEKT